MPEIEIIAEGRRIIAQDIVSASNLLDILFAYGVAPELGCDRIGRCGRCRVLAWGGLSPITDEERRCLGERALAEGWRLACQTWIAGDARVVLTVAGEVQVLAEGIGQPRRHGWSIKSLDELGIAIDLGTTTLAIQIVHSQYGELLASGGLLNPQTIIGPDVVSRIAYADKPDGREYLTGLLRSGVSRLIEEIMARQGVPISAVKSVVCVGNTVMDHLFLGISPHGLGQSPFHPMRTHEINGDAADFGLPLAPDANVYFPPLIGGFVGSDAVATALACGMGRGGKNRLVLDLGTNGELLLEVAGKTWCASAAAGPAFEGGSIRDGMRASAGALVDWAVQGGEVVYETVQNAAPRGIAGSCIIRIAAELKNNGVLHDNGRFAPIENWPDHIQCLYYKENGLEEVRVIPGGTLGLTQRDLRELQLAKGAIWAGIQGLLRFAKSSPEDIDEVLLAGALGTHTRPEDLITLGFVPKAFEGRIRSVGNAAIAGASQMLFQQGIRRELEEWVRTITHKNLADDPRFEEEFMDGMQFRVR